MSSVIRIVLVNVLLLGVLVALGIATTAPLQVYFDPLALGAVVLLPWLSVIGTHGLRPFATDQAKDAFRALLRRTWLVAIIVALIGPVAMLNNLVNATPSLPGPGFAVALLPILYAAALQLLVYIPLAGIRNSTR